MDLNKILNDFLNIIEYPSNKEEFIDKFIKSTYSETIDQLLKDLPQEKQESLKQQLINASAVEELKKVIDENFDQKQFLQVLQRTTQKLITEYLRTIQDELSDQQKAALSSYSPQNRF